MNNKKMRMERIGFALVAKIMNDSASRSFGEFEALLGICF